MSILTPFFSLVKEHIVIQEKLAKRYEGTEWRSERHIASRDGFASLLQAMQEADAALDSSPQLAAISVQPSALTLHPDELDGLPEELVAELSEGAIPDKTETSIINAIKERGGVATLDQIMVSYFRAANEVMKRTTMTSKLYRMIQKGSVFAAPGKKGIYSTQRLSEDDVKRIFGSEPQENNSSQPLA